MRALLLIDLQHDFLPGGALAVPRGDEVIAVANRVMPKFSLVVATQDWHPLHHQSFAAEHKGRKVGELIQLHGLPQILWPVHCVQRTFGAALATGLDIRRIDQVFTKGTDPAIDSYSGFFDNGHRQATGLGVALQKRGVDEVFVMGLATDYCVKFTVLDAIGLGLKVRLIEDGCRAVNLAPGDDTRAIQEMTQRGAQVLQSDQT
ncbi:MAG: bifunctional nicotinamidase/pyrazinamidase [Myxococcota bacterium]